MTGDISQRHAIARARRRRDDLWIAGTAIAAAFVALPFAQSSWHGSEAAAVLAVSATAMLAGQRWAIAIVALAELLLAPTLVVHAISGMPWPGRVGALAGLACLVPGLFAHRRAAAALVRLVGIERTWRRCRQLRAALLVAAAIAALVPLF